MINPEREEGNALPEGNQEENTIPVAILADPIQVAVNPHHRATAWKILLGGIISTAGISSALYFPTENLNFLIAAASIGVGSTVLSTIYVYCHYDPNLEPRAGVSVVRTGEENTRYPIKAYLQGVYAPRLGYDSEPPNSSGRMTPKTRFAYLPEPPGENPPGQINSGTATPLQDRSTNNTPTIS